MKSKLCLFVALCVGVPTSVLAHHSFAAEYDRDKRVKVTGTITKFDLSNPHSWVYLDVKGDDGTVASWAFETAAAGNLYRKGVRKDTLKPGMVITITGFGAKDNSHTADAQDVTMPDGTVMTLGTENSPG